MKTVQHAYCCIFLNCWINQNMHNGLNKIELVKRPDEQVFWSLIAEVSRLILSFCRVELCRNCIHSLFCTPCSISFKAFWVLFIIWRIQCAFNGAWGTLCFSMSTQHKPMMREYAYENMRNLNLTCTEEVALHALLFLHNSCTFHIKRITSFLWHERGGAYRLKVGEIKMKIAVISFHC